MIKGSKEKNKDCFITKLLTKLLTICESLYLRVDLD